MWIGASENSPRPPADRRRLPGRYASDLTPERMGRLFSRADAGELGPLLELEQEIWGKDTFVGGPIGDRLTDDSAVDLDIQPNPADPDQGRAVALAAYLEEVLPELAAYHYEPEGEPCDWGYSYSAGGPYRAPARASAGQVAVWDGGFSHAIESLSIPWYYGLGAYWLVCAPVPGVTRRPRPIGVAQIDPRRYRVDEWGRLFIETAEQPQGLALRSLDPLYWLSISASRAGLPARLAGVGRALVFWWWLKVGGAADLARYLEKFGLPNVVGERADPLGQGYDEDEDAELMEFLENYQNDVAALFPKGYKAIMLAAPQGGQAVFETIERVCRSAILYGILGNETSTTSAGGAAASSPGIAGGGASEGGRVTKGLVLSDRRRTAEALREIGRRSIFMELGAELATFPPLVQLLDASPTSPAPEGEPQAGDPAATARPSAAPPQPAAVQRAA